MWSIYVSYKCQLRADPHRLNIEKCQIIVVSNIYFFCSPPSYLYFLLKLKMPDKKLTLTSD